VDLFVQLQQMIAREGLSPSKAMRVLVQQAIERGSVEVPRRARRRSREPTTSRGQTGGLASAEPTTGDRAGCASTT
jgi:hypothetical protein